MLAIESWLFDDTTLVSSSLLRLLCIEIRGYSVFERTILKKFEKEERKKKKNWEIIFELDYFSHL